MAEVALTAAQAPNRSLTVWNGLVYIYPVFVVMLIWEAIAHSGMISRASVAAA